jgi:hypothetical protein
MSISETNHHFSFVVLKSELVSRYLETLPPAVQDAFRQKITDLGLRLKAYYFSENEDQESFPERGIKTVTITHIMAPSKNDSPDRTSPLYTEVRFQRTERIPPEETMDRDILLEAPAPVRQRSFYSALSKTLAKIYGWLRNFLAFPFCRYTETN